MGDSTGPRAVPISPWEPFLGERACGKDQWAGQVAEQDGSAPAGHAGSQGHSQHHATSSTVPDPQTWEQDLGPPCKCKGSCGPSCPSSSSHGPCVAHVGTGIAADLLLHGVQSASPHSCCSVLPAYP